MVKQKKSQIVVPNEKKIEYSHLHLDWNNVDWDRLHRPIIDYESEEQFEVILRAIRDIDNLYFTCKYILNLDPALFQLVWLETLFKYPFPMLIASRGLSKSWTLAVYLILRSLIIQGHKSIIVGAAFRQSKVIFEYVEAIWNNAPVLRDICGEGSGPRRQTDAWIFNIGHSRITALPLGTGDKIRGQRSNCTVADEFQSVPELVYEVVVGGFAAVSSDPSQNVKKLAKIKYMKEQGLLTKDPDDVTVGGIYRGNQAILAGTGDWGFKHFAKYWKKHRDIVNSKGDEKKLREIFNGNVDPNFNWKDYAVIRIPVDLGPPGFLEDKHVQKQKAQVHTLVFNQEYGACFPEDSDKFYKMSMIQACVTNEPIDLPSGLVQFSASLTGNRYRKYVIGVDPASESDNFAVVVLELHEDHRRVVYCWTTDRQRQQEQVRGNKTDEKSFYAYIARKIRSLMRLFPTEYIAMDAGGGGIGVMEALHDEKSLQPGEVPIWTIMHNQGKDQNPILWENAKDWGHDDFAGSHILEMVSMSNAAYVAEANHGMKRDLESRTLLFPFFDPISLNEAFIDDQKAGRDNDTLEDCVLEIEELKKELITIEHSTSLNGRDRWDTPEIVEAGAKKSHMRKDRYSALLMADSLARRVGNVKAISHQYVPAGGFIDYEHKKNVSGSLYTGPAWWCDQIGHGWGTVISK
jgi:hypothetical protein